MNRNLIANLFLSLFAFWQYVAAAPIPYSGKVAINGVNFQGGAQFTFALQDANGTTHWRNGVDANSSINVPVDRIWGLTGGRLAALRLPDGDRCSILFIDIHAGEVTSEVTDLPANATVDDENHRILLPARAGALSELSHTGAEVRVLRNLPDQEWIAFNAKGILQASKRATESI